MYRHQRYRVYYGLDLILLIDSGIPTCYDLPYYPPRI
jgi:hypothetical protein